MAKLFAAVATASLMFATACSRTDAGSGSGTIAATVEIKATELATTIEAQLSLRGAPLRNANVFATEVDSEASATLESSGSGGLYRTTMGGYARTIELRITAGEDNLEAVLEGPEPHRITRPANDVRVRRAGSEVLTVQWDADDLAERVEITAGGSSISVGGDLYEADLPLGPIPNGDHVLSVTRETSVDLAGGTSGSRMRSRYEVDNRFTLEG